MSSTGAAGPVTDASARERIVRNVDELSLLPRHPETFESVDVPKATFDLVRALLATDAIDVVRETDRRGDPTWQAYRLSAAASDLIDERLATRDTICPCGHAGVSNRGDHYACGFDLCDRRFERDDLEVDA